MADAAHATTQNWRWLPAIGSKKYYLLLGCVAILLLGPLGGVTAAYMNFSLGFFVGGQVLAGILGSAVTYGYGSDGKHGANYMQTMAASVAGMSGMCVLIQAMVWLGLPAPPDWHLSLFFMCIGMFGCGIGMLYTPILVDQMRLTYPSGLAVANILRALTDLRLLKQSISKLGTGTALGLLGGVAVEHVKGFGAVGLSTSTLGAGMIVGARITVPAIVVACIGDAMTPYLVAIGWLDKGAPFRKIFFILALGTIMGAAAVDITLILVKAVRQFSARDRAEESKASDWSHTNRTRLVAWTVFWAAALYGVATGLLGLPGAYVAVAMALALVFVLINGISTGISDSNPISSAFVVTVFVLAALGLQEPGVALLCAAILLVSTSAGVDMQQDRSTGWRLQTNRTIQFRYQVIGIVMGAIMTVAFARVFMAAYPVLAIDTFTHQGVEGAEKWQSAMTFKFVGAIRGIVHPKPFVMTALQIGIAIGLVTEVLRKVIKGHAGYQAWVKRGKLNYGADFLVDAVLLPSPYASSFGGFVDFNTSLWFGMGGILSSYASTLQEETARGPAQAAASDDVPEDMSTNSLLGGGLIAGDSLAALGLGVYGLLRTVLG
ncbi:MAG: OPT/YSL family transporter [Deltaproteobacteria bacterium]|nr:OPT/YSL family transporter [Deltaproteobacteria bacterium]